MHHIKRIVQVCAVLAVLAAQTACVVEEPREAYYDRDHNRYYHEHEWHECHEHDDYCH